MPPLPEIITPGEFSDVWNFTAALRKRAKKQSVIRKVAVPVSQLLYFAAFLILTYGAAYTMLPKTVQLYLEKLPVLVDLWNRFREFWFSGGNSEVEHLIRAGILLYGIPFAAALTVSLGILLLYHPRKPKPTGDSLRDARELHVLARHARHYADQEEPITVNICAVFAGMAIILAVLGYLILGPKGSKTAQTAAIQAHQLLIIGIVLALSYKLINRPLALLLKWLHRTRIPQNLISVTESYHRTLQNSTDS